METPEALLARLIEANVSLGGLEVIGVPRPRWSTSSRRTWPVPISRAALDRGAWWERLATEPAPAGVAAAAWDAPSDRRAALLLRVLRGSTRHPPSDLCFEVVACDWQGRRFRAEWGELGPLPPDHPTRVDARARMQSECPEHTFADLADVLLGRLLQQRED